MQVGGSYKFKYQSVRLIYLGRNFSGNGYWHQFAKANDPSRKVWSELAESDLNLVEEIQG